MPGRKKKRRNSGAIWWLLSTALLATTSASAQQGETSGALTYPNSNLQAAAISRTDFNWGWWIIGSVRKALKQGRLVNESGILLQSCGGKDNRKQLIFLSQGIGRGLA